MKEILNRNIDEFTGRVSSLLKEFVAALAIHQLGRQAVEMVDDKTAYSQPVGPDLQLEPLPMVFIKQFGRAYPSFILEVYQHELIQLWNLLLNKLFCVFLELHISGARRFSEFNIQKVRIDFDSDEDLINQLKESSKKEYSFQEYSKRVKTIDSALNPKKGALEELNTIRTHILIRNLIQHGEGVVNDYILRELGSKGLILLDGSGKPTEFKKGEKIILSVPEVYGFQKALLYVTQKWRG